MKSKEPQKMKPRVPVCHGSKANKDRAETTLLWEWQYCNFHPPCSKRRKFILFFRNCFICCHTYLLDSDWQNLPQLLCVVFTVRIKIIQRPWAVANFLSQTLSIVKNKLSVDETESMCVLLYSWSNFPTAPSTNKNASIKEPLQF